MMDTKRGGARFGVLVRMACSSMLIGLVGCGDSKREDAVPTPAAPEAAAPHFDIENFSDPTRIDNKWLPLAPGTQFTFEGSVEGEAGSVPHRVVFTVTDVTKVINGVRTLVMWDRDYNGDQLIEAEITFFAQDDAGTVWLLGEYPEEYDGERFEGAPSSWIAGLAGAKAGILMPAKPQKEGPPYLQGLAPDVDFYDVAKVYKAGQETCVPTGCYQDVMVIDEWDPLAQPQDGHELKYQAPGVGNIRVETMGGQDQETLVLTEFVKLSPEALADARQEALRLDGRAYGINARYEATPPAEPCAVSCGGLRAA
jgi:hypothetical protein